MNKSKVFIYISDVASYIGQNKWDYVTPFERLWKKCDRERYNAFISQTAEIIETKRVEIAKLNLDRIALEDDLANRRITQRQFAVQTKKVQNIQEQVTGDINRLQTRVDDIHLTQQQKLEKVVGKELIETIQSSTIETEEKRETFDKTVAAMDLDEEQLQTIREHGQSYINKTHGTLKEDSAIDMFETKFGVKLDTSQQLHKHYLYDSSINSEFHWFVCGKVDGLYRTNVAANNYIVEVKNRTRGFFNTLRDYEKTQIHMYMHMLEIKRSKLVEKYNDKIRVTDIYENEEYTQEITESLGVFLKTFEEKFLQNDKAKSEYLAKSNDEKQKYIYRTFFVPIERHLLAKMDAAADAAIDTAEADADDCMIDDLD